MQNGAPIRSAVHRGFDSDDRAQANDRGRRRERRLSPYRRGERDREGGRRAQRAFPEPSPREAACHRELDGAAPLAPPERALRARGGGVHRGEQGTRGPDRERGRRDLLSRRDRRDAALAPGGAPARAPGEGGQASRGEQAPAGGRALRVRDEPRSPRPREEGEIQEGSLLPYRRSAVERAAFARPQGRRSPARELFPRALREARAPDVGAEA